MKLNYKRTVLIGLASDFGALSDKVKTPIGRRMPFILTGTALAFVFIMVLPFADNSENLILFVVGLFVLLICMGTYRSPAVALMPDLTPKPLRSKANAVINLMGAVGGVFTLSKTNYAKKLALTVKQNRKK